MKKNIGLKKGLVRVEDYNSAWPDEFAKEKENLKLLFGDVAKEIEHMGSTSVRGLSSKPIIDIAIGVDALEDINKVKSKILELPQYTIKNNNAAGEILMRKGTPVKMGEEKPDYITHFIHIMEIKDIKYKETIAFRNFLRANPDALNKYENLKIRLSIKYKNDRKSYTKAKNDFIKGILEKITHQED